MSNATLFNSLRKFHVSMLVIIRVTVSVVFRLIFIAILTS